MPEGGDERQTKAGAPPTRKAFGDEFALCHKAGVNGPKRPARVRRTTLTLRPVFACPVQIASFAPQTQEMGGRNSSCERATEGGASKTGRRDEAEKAARATVSAGGPALCTQWHWQPTERQQSCLLAGVWCANDALVEALAACRASFPKSRWGWAGQSAPLCPGASTPRAKFHCKPMVS